MAMVYQYFIDRMTKLMPLRGIRSTQIVSLVDEQLEVLGAQLMRTQAPVQLEDRDHATHFYMPDYLFVGLTSELPDDPTEAPYHCLCIDDAPLPDSYLNGTLRSNLIVLQMQRNVPDENMMFALNHAVFILSDEMRYYRGLERVNLAEQQKPELSDALELVCQLIVNSAAVVDTRGNVLAANTAYPFALPELNTQIAAGQVEPALLKQLQEQDVYGDMRTQYFSMLDMAWSFQAYVLLVPLCVRGLRMAWLIVQNTRTALHHSSVRLLEPISGLLAGVLERQMEEHNDRSLLHSLLFQELLRADAAQEPSLRLRIEELRWKQCDGMRVLCCSGESAAFEALQRAYPDCRWTVVGSEQLLLLYPDEEQNPPLAEKLAELGLRAGISWPFDDLMQLRWAYQQAQAALQRSTGTLTPYSRVFAAHVMTLPPAQLPQFVHPAIWKLSAYDATHEGSLLDTMESVLAGPEQLSEVAEQLFVHRSTLFYRLGRIRELGDVDLSNGEERMNLLLSLRLLQEHDLLPRG